MRYPHPCCATMFEAVFRRRLDTLGMTISGSLATSDLRNTFRQETIMRHWAVSKEFEGMSASEREERLATVAHLESIAAHVLASGDCIFDVSRIGADLTELELPTIEACDFKLARAHASYSAWNPAYRSIARQACSLKVHMCLGPARATVASTSYWSAMIPHLRETTNRRLETSFEAGVVLGERTDLLGNRGHRGAAVDAFRSRLSRQARRNGRISNPGLLEGVVGIRLHDGNSFLEHVQISV